MLWEAYGNKAMGQTQVLSGTHVLSSLENDNKSGQPRSRTTTENVKKIRQNHH